MKTKEDLKNKIEIYTSIIPRFNLFSRTEQEELISEAERNAKEHSSDFLHILANLTLLKSFRVGEKLIVS